MPRHLAVATSSLPARYERRHNPRSSIRMHWGLFASVFLAIVALGTIGTLLLPKHYTATVKMIAGSAQTAIDAEQKPSSLSTSNAPAQQNAISNSDTIADLIQDGPVVDKVITTLKLGESRAQLLGKIAVKPVANTSIIGLSASAESPAQAAAIANTFASVFTDLERDLISSQAVAAQNSLQQAVSNAQNALQRANSALSSYQATYRIADSAAQTQSLLQRVEATDSRIEELQDDQQQAQAELSSAQSQIAALPAAELRQQLAVTEQQLATARQRYTDKFPAVKALEKQRDDLQSQLAAAPASVAEQVNAAPNPVYQQLSQQEATLRNQIQGDTIQIADLQRRRTALGPAIAALPSRTTQLGLLQERANVASDVYKSLQQKYDDAVVAANGAISDVTVVQPADANNVSVSPNLVLNIAISIALGLIFGLLAAAIANAIQRRIHEDRDVERIIGLPVIAHIPNMTTRHQHALPWLQTVTLEAFLHLCASLRVLGRKSETYVIVITSPEKGDGKTTIACHLASAMSRIRSSVLLIDGDMRSPALHRQANIENGPGLSDVLSGSRSFDQAVVHYTPTLDVLTAGTHVPNPLELVQSASLDDLLDFARERYDCVIIDTPALTPVVDSIVIAARADSTALVVSANNSHEEAAAQAISRLRALGVDNILGVVMNRTKTKFSDYGDYHFSDSPSLQSAR